MSRRLSFSIVTPTILRPSLLQLCRSIDEQSHPYWQHIVVVDMDKIPDDRAVLREIGHPQRRILRCDRAHYNYGNTCRHNAYGHATGDFVMYVDDDDYLADENVLRDLVGAVKEPWALFPILRHGQRSYSDNPIRGVSCSVVAMRWMAEWPDTNDYDADGLYIKHLIELSPCHFLPDMRPLVVQPLSGGIGRNSSIRIGGREWTCWDDMVGGYHWIAETREPLMRVTAGSWDELVAEIKTCDPANPRVDAVAVCDPLPGVDILGTITGAGPRQK